MQHVQLHVTFFSCIKQVAKDNFSTSVLKQLMFSSPILGVYLEGPKNGKTREGLL
jgi:hypothetical protein